MNDLLIYFDYNGQPYSGIFRYVSDRSFQLFTGSSYRGQLDYSERYGWQFSSSDRMFEELSNWFGEQVMDFYFVK